MDCGTRVGFVILLLGTLAYQASSQKAVYGLRGRSILLSIEKSLLQGISDVTSFIWKHNQDKAAEWFIGDTQPTYFRTFNSTATLDMNTWALNISNLQSHFDGMYSAEVNHMDTNGHIDLTVIDAEVYGVKGKSITLLGKVPKREVDYAQWTLNGNVIVDWGAEDRQASYSWPNMEFNVSASLLIISKLTSNSTGVYAFKTNIEDKAMVYHLMVEDAMLTAQVTKECNSSGCWLNCSVPDEGNAPVTWTSSAGGDTPGPLLWVDRNKDMDLTYTCYSPNVIAKNISQKELFPNSRTEEHATNNVPVIVPVGVLIGCLGLMAGVAFWKKDAIRRQCSRLKQWILHDEDNAAEMQDRAQPEAGAEGVEPRSDTHLLAQTGNGGEGCAEETV